MARELRPIDISQAPELLKLAAELQSGKKPIVLRRENQDVAIVTAVAQTPARARHRPVTKDSPLWNMVGIARSTGPTDVSSNKKKYLAEAYHHT